MPERSPMTERMKASEARQQWSNLLGRVFRKEARVIVEKSGIPVAAIISAEDLERFNRLQAERDERFKVLERMRTAFKNVPDDELETEIARAIKEVRQEHHEGQQHAAEPE